MVLVHQVEGASVNEFARLATTQLLVVQEGRIWTQLWEKKQDRCGDLGKEYYVVTVDRTQVIWVCLQSKLACHWILFVKRQK